MPTRRLAFFGLIVFGSNLLAGCDGGSTRPGTDGGIVPRADGRVPGTDARVPTRCEPPPEPECASSLGALLPMETTASTAGGTDGFSGATCARGGGAGIPDVAFQWTAPIAGRFDISTAGSGFDTVLTVRRGCTGEIIACNDDVSGSQQARITIELAECETVLIVVDGFSARDVGAVRVSISGRESSCQDGLDDDGDGLVDCEDTQDCRIRECIEDGEWPEAWATFEWRVLELTNEARARGASCGGEPFAPAGPLEMDEVIRIAARLHSQDMGEQGYFEHDSLDGRTFADRMRMVGFDGPGPWGENIAAGQRSPEDVVQGWMNSPGHCRNIMNPDYHVIGIGYAYVESSPFGHYWTQDFAGGH